MLESDPLDFKLDENGDLLVDEDGIHLVSGAEGVAQLLRIRLRLFQGEWFLNLDAGVPYYQEILGEKPNDSLLRQRIVEAIQDTPGIVEILSLGISFDAATRRVSVSGKVRTEFGDADLDALIGGSNA